MNFITVSKSKVRTIFRVKLMQDAFKLIINRT